MIRLATVDDVPRLVEMGRALTVESPRLSRMRYCRDKVARLLVAWIESDIGLVLVAESDGNVIGVAVAVIDSEWFSTDPVAQEMVLYVAPAHRGSHYAAALIDGMDAWAESRGALLLQAGSSTGIRPEQTIRLYEKRGFERAGMGVMRVYR